MYDERFNTIEADHGARLDETWLDLFTTAREHLFDDRNGDPAILPDPDPKYTPEEELDFPQQLPLPQPLQPVLEQDETQMPITKKTMTTLDINQKSTQTMMIRSLMKTFRSRILMRMILLSPRIILMEIENNKHVHAD